MKIIKTNLDNSRVRLEIHMPVEKMASFLDRVYQKLASTVEIRGFRPGHAPRSLTLEAIGHGRYQQEVLNETIAETYIEAVRQENLSPIEQPAITVKSFGEDKGLVYEAEVDILPKVKLCDYHKIKVEKIIKNFKAAKEEVDLIIKRLLSQAATLKEINRPLKNGDWAEIEFEGYVDSIKRDGLSSKNFPLILGQKTLLPDFEKALIGLRKEEATEFKINAPLDKTSNKRQPVLFKVKILNTKEVILPILNDEFAKSFGKKDLVELKKAIEQDIISNKQVRAQKEQENEIIEKMIQQSRIAVPRSLVESEINRILVDLQKRLGSSFEQFLAKNQKTIPDLRKDFEKNAQRQVKTGLVLGEFAKQEGIKYPHGLKNTPEDQHAFTQQIIKKLLEIIQN